MTPEQVHQMIQQEIHKSQQAQRFNLNSIPRHTHNGVDSPTIFQSSFVYAGAVNTDGTPALLPQGWTSKIGTAGSYTITHNLNTELYSASFTGYAEPANTIFQAILGTNVMNISSFEVGVGAVSNAFYFLLINTNNLSTIPPIYYGSLVNSGTIG